MTGPQQGSFRWANVARGVWPFLLISLLAAGLYAADAWLPLFPREPGRRLTELFLRSILIVYMGALALIPLLLVVSIWIVIRARRRGQRRPFWARLGLLCGSAGLAVIGLELTASVWLAWTHRMPHLPTTFPHSATDQSRLSLIVIGGSSAMGYLYDPTISVGQIVAWKLQQAQPGRRVDLDIRASLGKNLEDMHKELASLKQRPDALIIYSGHNEYLSRFETHRDAGYSEAPEVSLLRPLYQLSLRSPLCLWVYEAVRHHRLGGPPPAINHHQLIDAPAFTPSEHLQIVTFFRRRLESIVAYCEQICTVPILIIPSRQRIRFRAQSHRPFRGSLAGPARVADRAISAGTGTREERSGAEPGALSIAAEQSTQLRRSPLPARPAAGTDRRLCRGARALHPGSRSGWFPGPLPERSDAGVS